MADWLDAGQPWHGLPRRALLRLLGALCYDVAQGFLLRADIHQRLQARAAFSPQLMPRLEGGGLGHEAPAHGASVGQEPAAPPLPPPARRCTAEAQAEPQPSCSLRPLYGLQDTIKISTDWYREATGKPPRVEVRRGADARWPCVCARAGGRRCHLATGAGAAPALTAPTRLLGAAPALARLRCATRVGPADGELH